MLRGNPVDPGEDEVVVVLVVDVNCPEVLEVVEELGWEEEDEDEEEVWFTEDDDDVVVVVVGCVSSLGGSE